MKVLEKVIKVSRMKRNFLLMFDDFYYTSYDGYCFKTNPASFTNCCDAA